MTLDATLRDQRSSLVAIGLALLCAAPLVIAASTGEGAKGRLLAIGVPALLLLAASLGNIRLFLIWGYGLTMPLSLSKYFGVDTFKGGGETAYRIDASDLFVFGLALFILFEILQGKRRGVRIPRFIWPWLLLSGWGLLVILGGYWKTAAAEEMVRMFKMAFGAVILISELQRPKRLLHFAGGLILGAVLNSGVGIAEYLLHRTFGLEFLGESDAHQLSILASNSVQDVKVFRVSGLLLHPNLLGIFLGALLPVAIGVFLLKKGFVVRAYFAVSAVAMLVTLILTLSRSSWVSFAAAFVVLLILTAMHPRLRRNSMIAGAGAVIALMVVGIAFYGPITTRLFDSRDDASEGREAFKEDAKSLIDSAVMFGSGLNGYAYNVRDFMKTRPDKYDGGWIPPVHNIYYLWWAETGFVGLCVFLIHWAWIVWYAILNFGVRDEVMYTLNAAAFAGMVAFAIDGYFSFTLRVTPTQKEFWAFAIIIMSVYYWRMEQKAKASLPAVETDELVTVA